MCAKIFFAYTPEPEPPRSRFLPGAGAGATRKKKELEPPKWGSSATLPTTPKSLLEKLKTFSELCTYLDTLLVELGRLQLKHVTGDGVSLIPQEHCTSTQELKG